MGWGFAGCFGCIALFTGSCGEKNKQYMLSHPHGVGFNMEPCIPCEEKRLSNTETDAENRCSNKTERPSQAVLWKF